MGGYLGGSVGQWVGSGQITKMNKSWPNQNDSILFEDLWFVGQPYPWVGVWVVGWVNGSMGGSGQKTKNLISFELIEIIQFCLKIYDL